MKLSAFDRFTLALFPRWTQDRIRARMAVDLATRHYDANASGRRTSGWTRNGGDANWTIGPAAYELRINARDLIRNNAWARNGQKVIANNTVGTGIRPSPDTASALVRTNASDLWRRWAGSTECETEGLHTFYSLQRLCMRALFSDGEVFIRRRARKAKDNLTIPLQLQVMESDYLDTSKNLLTNQSGGYTIQGIEYDAIGRRSAYWLYPQHPGSGLNYQNSVRIQATEILHIFDAERPGQGRGISWLGAAIVTLKDLSDFDDAELMKQKVAACFAAFVTDPDGQAPIGLDGTDAAGNADPQAIQIQPGMIERLPPGKSITFATPPQAVDSTFANRQLRRVAAALGVTYEDLTGDYSQVNYSSARMARMSHWSKVVAWQQDMLIPMLCTPVWNWAMDAAVLAEELPIAPTATWTTPPMPMIEPDKEGLAYQRAVRSGFMTHDEMVREQGGDPDVFWPAYSAGLKRLDALGIKLDTDVRAVSQAGQAQSVPGESDSDSVDTSDSKSKVPKE